VQSHSPSPLEALRGHSHVVVFAPRDGGSWTSIGSTIEGAGVDVKVIGHPLLCMAALCWREFNGRRPGSRESTAFVAVDVDDIERLAPMFKSIGAKLPHVSVWVIAADLFIRVIEGKPRLDPPSSADHRAAAAHSELESKHPVPRRTPPQLRIARTATNGEPDVDGPDSGAADQPQREIDRIEAILRAGAAAHEPQNPTDHLARPGTQGAMRDAAGRDACTKQPDSRSGRVEPDEMDDPGDGFVGEPEPSAARLTSDEIAMLMGDLDEPASGPNADEPGADGPGARGGWSR
jgi:hypothetical protein